MQAALIRLVELQSGPALTHLASDDVRMVHVDVRAGDDTCGVHVDVGTVLKQGLHCLNSAARCVT